VEDRYFSIKERPKRLRCDLHVSPCRHVQDIDEAYASEFLAVFRDDYSTAVDTDGRALFCDVDRVRVRVGGDETARLCLLTAGKDVELVGEADGGERAAGALGG